MIAGIFFAILFFGAVYLTYCSFKSDDSVRDKVEIVLLMIYTGLGSIISFTDPEFASTTWFTIVKYVMLAALLVTVFSRRFEK